MRASAISPDAFTAGELYEPYIGRWSKLVAAGFIDWLAADAAKDWLDVGCGTGALTKTIIERAQPRTVIGVDPSADFIGYATNEVPDATFRIGDASELPVDTDTIDVAVSGLVLNFVPDPSKAISEMTRCVRSEGVVAVYVWDYADKMEMLRYFWDAATALDPEARNLDEGARFGVCGKQPLAELFDAELLNVDVRAIDVPTYFETFDDFWDPFLGGQGPAGSYVVSLPDDHREALKNRLWGTLPIDADDSISLIARAWAAKGYVR